MIASRRRQRTDGVLDTVAVYMGIDRAVSKTRSVRSARSVVCGGAASRRLGPTRCLSMMSPAADWWVANEETQVLLVVLLVAVLTIVSVYALSRRYRETVRVVRERGEQVKTKYDVALTTIERLNEQVRELRATVVQRDVEIAELKSKG